MRQFTLLAWLIVLSCFSAVAQPDLRTHYSAYTTSDSVKSLHISKLTITKEYCKDTSNDRYQCITTETFDRNGNQLTQDHVYPGNGYSGPEYIYHHFTYDQKGRIIIDSTKFRGEERTTTYTYDADNHHVVIHRPPEFYDSSETIYITYHDTIIDSSYGVDHHGDTVYVFQRTNSGSRETVWHRNTNGNLVIQERNDVAKTEWELLYTRYCAGCDQYLNQSERITLDSNKRIQSREVETNSVPGDLFHYEYDSNYRLVKTTWTDFMDSAVGMQTTIFYYNKAGQLVETTSSYTSSKTVIHSYYKYNEKGLVTRVIEDSGNGFPECVKYEYEYY